MTSVLWHVLFDKRRTNYKNNDLKGEIRQSIDDRLGSSGRSVLSDEALASLKEPQTVPTASWNKFKLFNQKVKLLCVKSFDPNISHFLFVR